MTALVGLVWGRVLGTAPANSRTEAQMKNVTEFSSEIVQKSRSLSLPLFNISSFHLGCSSPAASKSFPCVRLWCNLRTSVCKKWISPAENEGEVSLRTMMPTWKDRNWLVWMTADCLTYGPWLLLALRITSLLSKALLVKVSKHVLSKDFMCFVDK